MAERVRRRDRVHLAARNMIRLIPGVGPDLEVYFENVLTPRLVKPRDRLLDGLKALFRRPRARG